MTATGSGRAVLGLGNYGTCDELGKAERVVYLNEMRKTNDVRKRMSGDGV
jgi:hypothetical protein